MSKSISPVKPLLAAIVVASGAHATASDANSALLSKTKTDFNTVDSVLKQDVKTITQSQHRRLEKAWQLVIQQLHQTANSSRWGTIMYRSFGVDLTVAETLRQSWARNNFADLPAVEIADLSKVAMLSNNNNKRAIAAYSATNNRIYLSQQLLDNATAKQLAKVWLEEIGHSIDNRFNQIDTIGDEGAIFAKLITDSNTESLEQDLELNILQASNDHALLPIENQYRPVELATIEVGASCTLNNAIISANSDTATGGCTAGSGADEITFNASTDNTLITMTGQGAIGSDLTITGNGMSPTTVIQAGSGNRHFQLVEAGSPSATIANLTLTGASIVNSGASITTNAGTSLTLDRVEITNSSSMSNTGGAIRTQGTLNIHNSYLHQNTAAGGGGAIFTGGSGNILISSTLIANNTSEHGGGIQAYSYDGSLNIKIVNSTLYSNSTTDATGGGNLGFSGYAPSFDVDIVNSTISHGSAPSGKGGNIKIPVFNGGGSIDLTLVNSIVANNVMGGDCDINSSNTELTVINSLVEDGCENIDTETNLVTGDPMLGTLADNGGAWPTMALLTGSPAIDAGVNVRSSTTFSEVAFGFDLNGDGDATDTGLNIEDIAYDARGTGFARVTGSGIDIGAFEFGSGGSTPTPAPTIPLRWDIDGNGVSEMSDGSLVLRYLYGFRGDVLIADAIGTGASLTTAVQIEPAIQALVADYTLDIDGNSATTTVDGSLLLRYLSGYTGQTLINRAIGQGATRSNTSTITAYIELPDS